MSRDGVVAIVIEGDTQTLEAASDAVKAGIPLLVFAGSGKSADFIAAAYDKREQMYATFLLGLMFFYASSGDVKMTTESSLNTI